MTSKDSSSTLDANAVIAETYRPIVRGYFAVAFAYYAIMTVLHCITMSGVALGIMTVASVSASLLLFAAWYWLHRPLTIGKLEILTSVVNLMVMANVQVALHIEYAEPKLAYFIMMAMIFAFASVSMRQAIVSVVFVLGGLFVELVRNDSSQLSLYGFVAFAAALSALAITYFLRRAVGLAAVARHKAEIRLSQAESVGETMRKRSLSDSLTGLPNRRAFFETFEWNPIRADLEKYKWLILLDLDGFKAVNDLYGHIMGDELLKAVSVRLSEFAGDEAHVSRMGGDEFNLILHHNGGPSDVESWCQNLLDHVAKVYFIDDRLIQISASIGCIEVSDAEAVSELVRNADYALLHAKNNGKNRVTVFREEHARDAAERFRIEQALRIANFDAEIKLLFQPQYDLKQEKIIRAEALARWDSPSIGKIEPDIFIKIAESSGLIAKISLTVLSKAMCTIENWDDPIPISINLSGHDLISDEIMDQIISLLAKSNIDPALIEFEVTETAMMADMEKASTNLNRLAELGHPLALDDFGTGYSNFNYLRTLPIDRLKIDRSFMENIGDPMTEKVLHSLVGMAATLEVDCLLEGIENELQLIMAKRAGAQSVQGF
ncbi:EAL domain-containing protein, partial [Parasphingorhabdus sp.]